MSTGPQLVRAEPLKLPAPIPLPTASFPDDHRSFDGDGFYNSGYCWRGDACWFSHAELGPPTAGPSSAKHPLPLRPSDGLGPHDAPKASADPQDDPERLNARQQACRRDQKEREAVPDAESHGDEDAINCCICFETPKLYGLLENCSHVFCMACIRTWRMPKGKVPDQVASGNLRKCPACRVESAFTLSSKTYHPDGPEKARLVASCKAKWATIPCKNFERFRDCAFGYECFYKHVDRRGNPVTLNHSHAEYLLRRERQRELDDARFDIDPYLIARMLGLNEDRVGSVLSGRGGPRARDASPGARQRAQLARDFARGPTRWHGHGSEHDYLDYDYDYDYDDEEDDFDEAEDEDEEFSTDEEWDRLMADRARAYAQGRTWPGDQADLEVAHSDELAQSRTGFNPASTLPDASPDTAPDPPPRLQTFGELLASLQARPPPTPSASVGVVTARESLPESSRHQVSPSQIATPATTRPLSQQAAVEPGDDDGDDDAWTDESDDDDDDDDDDDIWTDASDDGQTVQPATGSEEAEAGSDEERSVGLDEMRRWDHTHDWPRRRRRDLDEPYDGAVVEVNGQRITYAELEARFLPDV